MTNDKDSDRSQNSLEEQLERVIEAINENIDPRGIIKKNDLNNLEQTMILVTNVIDELLIGYEDFKGEKDFLNDTKNAVDMDISKLLARSQAPNLVKMLALGLLQSPLLQNKYLGNYLGWVVEEKDGRPHIVPQIIDMQPNPSEMHSGNNIIQLIAQAILKYFNRQADSNWRRHAIQAGFAGLLEVAVLVLLKFYFPLFFQNFLIIFTLLHIPLLVYLYWDVRGPKYQKLLLINIAHLAFLILYLMPGQAVWVAAAVHLAFDLGRMGMPWRVARYQAPRAGEAQSLRIEFFDALPWLAPVYIAWLRFLRVAKQMESNWKKPSLNTNASAESTNLEATKHIFVANVILPALDLVHPGLAGRSENLGKIISIAQGKQAAGVKIADEDKIIFELPKSLYAELEKNPEDVLAVAEAGILLQMASLRAIRLLNENKVEEAFGLPTGANYAYRAKKAQMQAMVSHKQPVAAAVRGSEQGTTPQGPGLLLAIIAMLDNGLVDREKLVEALQGLPESLLPAGWQKLVLQAQDSKALTPQKDTPGYELLNQFSDLLGMAELTSALLLLADPAFMEDALQGSSISFPGLSEDMVNKFITYLETVGGEQESLILAALKDWRKNEEKGTFTLETPALRELITSLQNQKSTKLTLVTTSNGQETFVALALGRDPLGSGKTVYLVASNLPSQDLREKQPVGYRPTMGVLLAQDASEVAATLRTEGFGYMPVKDMEYYLGIMETPQTFTAQELTWLGEGSLQDALRAKLTNDSLLLRAIRNYQYAKRKHLATADAELFLKKVLYQSIMDSLPSAMNEKQKQEMRTLFNATAKQIAALAGVHLKLAKRYGWKGENQQTAKEVLALDKEIAGIATITGPITARWKNLGFNSQYQIELDAMLQLLLSFEGAA